MSGIWQRIGWEMTPLELMGVVGVIALIVIIPLGIKDTKKTKGEQGVRETQISDILTGEHILRRMASVNGIDGKLSGSFFLLSGSVEGTIKSEMSITFAWEVEKGQYYLSTLPIEKIRVHINQEVETPVIRFNWRKGCGVDPIQIQEVMDQCVIYSTLSIRESDWPVQVGTPL